MKALELFNRKKKEAQQNQEGGQPLERGQALAEILSDRKSSYLFGRLLEQEGAQELAGRLMSGNLSSYDMETLEEKRKRYLEMVAQSEKIEGLLNEETVLEVANANPDFQRIINLVGPQKAIKVIRAQLRELRFTDEWSFNRIAGPVEDYYKYKNKEYKKTGTEIDQLLKDLNITAEEYTEALAITDPAEKKAALIALIKSKYGEFERARNFVNFGGITRQNLEKLIEGEETLEAATDKLDAHKRSIGTGLFLTLDGNADIRQALARELISERGQATPEPETGFRDAKQGAGSLNDKEFNEAWEEDKKNTGYDNNFDPVKREFIKDRFIDTQRKAYREKNKGGAGFWDSVLSAFFEGQISSKKSELK